MKKYLIEIENGRISQHVTIYGDCPSRPFMIANNLWNYSTPWHAAQRLEKLAKSWEGLGLNVRRVYGTVWDMPTGGDKRNTDLIRLNYGWIE